MIAKLPYKRNATTVLSVPFLLLLAVSAGCRPAQEDSALAKPSPAPSTRSTEELVAQYLAKHYRQPQGNVWEEGQVYFLPEKPGIELMQDLPLPGGHRGLRVYRVALWFIHWGPEQFNGLVWVTEESGKVELGAFDSQSRVITEFPLVLSGWAFEQRDVRQSLALLIGRMVTEFGGEWSPGTTLQVTEDGNCQWAEQPGIGQAPGTRVVAACFTESGVLDRIVLVKRPRRPRRVA